MQLTEESSLVWFDDKVIIIVHACLLRILRTYWALEDPSRRHFTRVRA